MFPLLENVPLNSNGNFRDRSGRFAATRHISTLCKSENRCAFLGPMKIGIAWRAEEVTPMKLRRREFLYLAAAPPRRRLSDTVPRRSIIRRGRFALSSALPRAAQPIGCPPHGAVAVGTLEQSVRGGKPHRRGRHASRPRPSSTRLPTDTPFCSRVRPSPSARHSTRKRRDVLDEAGADWHRDARAQYNGRNAVAAGKDRKGIHRLRQSQSGTSIDGVIGRGRVAAPVRRDFKFMAKSTWSTCRIAGRRRHIPDSCQAKSMCCSTISAARFCKW